MFAKTLMTVALLGLAAPAMAQGVSQGHNQLAHELGVNPSQFTSVELIQLDTAKRSNDQELWNRIIGQEPGVTRGANTPTTMIVPDYADNAG